MKTMNGRIASFLVLLVAAGWTVTAQAFTDRPVMPEGRQGQRIQALLVNGSGPVDAILRDHCSEAVRKAFPPGEAAAELARWRRLAGKVTLHGVRTYDPPRPEPTVVIVKTANLGEWRAFAIRCVMSNYDEGAEPLVRRIGEGVARIAP